MIAAIENYLPFFFLVRRFFFRVACCVSSAIFSRRRLNSLRSDFVSFAIPASKKKKPRCYIARLRRNKKSLGRGLNTFGTTVELPLMLPELAGGFVILEGDGEALSAK